MTIREQSGRAKILLSDNARVVLERRYLARDADGRPTETPEEMFHRFPETGTAEIHLATGFQNLMYDSSHLPDSLRQEMYSFLKETCHDEWKEGQTEAQFIYRTRKKALGPFKRRLWDLPEESRRPIRDELEGRFWYLFQQLNVVGTRALISDSGAPALASRP